MPDGIVMRIHKVRTEMVVAACDQELLGRELPVGTKGRTVRITSDFYGERPVGQDELLWAIRRATIVNLLGARVLAIARREGFIAEGGETFLGGVPHAEIIGMTE